MRRTVKWVNRVLQGRTRATIAAAAALYCCGIFPTAAPAAAKFNRVLDLDAQAPVWRDLPGDDGRRHSLDDFQEAPIVVLVFTRNHCPMSRNYERRLADFGQAVRDKGVAFVAINVSPAAAKSAPIADSGAQQKERGWPGVTLYDESQSAARSYGATVTPQFFVLDRQRKVAYMGAFDDHSTAAKATRHYVADAVAALLAGKSVEIKESLPRGCAIEFRSAAEASQKSVVPE